MPETRSKLLAAAIFALLALQTGVVNPQRPSPQPDSHSLTAARVSEEPDTDERENSLRWSPDGERVAWMQWALSPTKGPGQEAQRSIWSFATQFAGGKPQSDSPTPAPSAPAPAAAIQLLSATAISDSLRGSAAKPHLQSDDESESNPFLLSDFEWSSDHASLLLIGVQSLAWLDLASGNSRLLVPAEHDLPISSVALSPDGRSVSFVRDRSLWVVAIHGGQPRLIARPAHPWVYEGEPDWPYRNELHLARASWWSPDSSSIAYMELDDRAVARYQLTTSDGDTRQIVYPRPGGAIPIPRLFVRRLAGAAPTEVHLPAPNPTPLPGNASGYYLPRVSWLPDSRHLALQRLDRFQHKLELFLADTTTLQTRLLLHEQDLYWVNLSDDLRFLPDGKRFLWTSQKSGFRHLYLYDLAGKQLAQLTAGDWEVTAVNAVDSTQGTVYFTATEKTPLERHLYRVSLNGGPVTRITNATGTHTIHFAPGNAAFADCFSSADTQPQLNVYRTSNPETSLATTSPGGSDTASQESAASASHALQTHHDTQSFSPALAFSHPGVLSSATPLPPLQPVEFLDLKLHLGAQIHAFLIKPPGFDPSKKYPVIVYLAGGPGEQLVRNAWGGATGLWMQLMAQKGYLIFAMDNQGTAGRGHPFEEPIHLRLGAQELTDQRDGLFYLNSLPWVDTTRLGVCGWGYGGYLVLHALLDRPVAFRAGFAGAPVVDWRLYDAVFPEKYLEDSVAHSDGWDASSALENNSPHFFKSALLIAQGTMDESVHIENLLTVQDRLLDQGKSAEVLLFSDRGHSIDDPPARLVLFTRMTDFFVRNL